MQNMFWKGLLLLKAEAGTKNRKIFIQITLTQIMATQIKEFVEKLDHIQSDLNFIKKHINDVDLVLTDDNLEALYEAEEDLAAGKTKRI